MEKNKKRKYRIISIQDGCWMYLGSAKNYKKALGTVYKFFHEVIEEDEEFSIKTDIDTANFMWEQITATCEENDNHGRLEYPVMIFYDDKLITDDK